MAKKNMFQTKKVLDVLDGLYTPPVVFFFFAVTFSWIQVPEEAVPGFLGDRQAF